MKDVSIRDLRNQGGIVLGRVSRGEALTVTRNGQPIAELRPLPGKPLSAETLLNRWRRLPRVDEAALKSDIDTVLDAIV